MKKLKRIRKILLLIAFCYCLFLPGITVSADMAISDYAALVYGVDNSGNPVSVSGGFPVYVEDIGVVVISCDFVLEGATELVVASTVNGEYQMEQIIPVIQYEDLGVLVLVPSDGSVLIERAQFPVGSMENIKDTTQLIQIVFPEEGMVQTTNTCVGYSAPLYQLQSEYEDALVGTPVFNSDTMEVIGMIAGVSPIKYMVELETVVNTFRADFEDALNGSGGSGDTTGSDGTGSTVGSGGSGSTTDSGTTGGSGQSVSESGSGIWGFVILGIAIILVVLIVRNTTNKKGMEEYTSSDSGHKPSHIVCISGMHAGAEFPLDDVLVFGRDNSRCNVVFPADTPGVSGMHCRICLIGEQIELTDLGSSFGTFLSYGKKLEPHVPYVLKSGDVFYLANSEYSYQVK